MAKLLNLNFRNTKTLVKVLKVNSDKIFFTSDTHFGHKGLLHFNKRPFKDEVEMDLALINNWNNIVPPDGTVFLLGDIGEITDERLLEIFEQLNGSKILLRGNHDTVYKEDTLQKVFTEVHDILEIKVHDTLSSQYQKIILCHYPMFDWNNFHEGSWQLFGHLHTREIPEFKTLKTKLFAQQYDVGVDGNGFRPVSFYEIKKIIEKQIQDESFKSSNYY